MRYKGFTLIETILASAILCGSVLVIGAACTRSLNATRLNRQYETATALAEKQLVLIDYIGIEDFILMGQMEGVLEKLNPVYHWQVSAEKVGIEELYDVRMTVSWVERKNRYDVLVHTRLNGTGEFIEEAGI